MLTYQHKHLQGTNVFTETCWLFFFPWVNFNINFLPIQTVSYIDISESEKADTVM